MDEKIDFLKLVDDHKPLREVVFQTLREAIITGSLKPGQRLMEVQMAESMGVSRTPVREAIRKLELEGLVMMIPRKGAYVTDVSIRDITDVLEIRAELEGLASSLAAERITQDELEHLELVLYQFNKAIECGDVEKLIEKDVEFHNIIYNASRNQRLVAIVNSLREQVQRFRVMYFNEVQKSPKIVAEHQEILDAIAERNVDKAQSVARKHIQNAELFILSSIGEEEGER